MTDRTLSLVVTLDNEMRTDDVDPLIHAIQMIKGVNSVSINVFSGSDHINAYAYKQKWISEFAKQLFDIIRKEQSS